MTPELHFECSLEQADGRFDLERGDQYGDSNDLFSAGPKDRFTGTTSPNSQWWDGTPSGLEVTEISASGPTMTFRARR